jgi:hypothetical protein
LLLVGFFAALRRSELAGLTVDQLTDDDRELAISIARSKTNQTGAQRELVVLPRTNPASAARSPRCAPGSPPAGSPTGQCCARSAPATAPSIAGCTRSRSTTSCRTP